MSARSSSVVTMIDFETALFGIAGRFRGDKREASETFAKRLA
jgi:hypothetical protein